MRDTSRTKTVKVKAKRKIVRKFLAFLIFAGVVFSVFAILNGIWPFGGGWPGESGIALPSLNNSSQGTTAVTDSDAEDETAEELQETDTSEIIWQPEEEESAQDESDEGYIDSGPPSMLIEIYESRIVYSDNDVTIDELEAVLLSFADVDGVWELRDSHQAARATYEEVSQLLNRLGILFEQTQ